MKQTENSEKESHKKRVKVWLWEEVNGSESCTSLHEFLLIVQEFVRSKTYFIYKLAKTCNLLRFDESVRSHADGKWHQSKANRRWRNGERHGEIYLLTYLLITAPVTTHLYVGCDAWRMTKTTSAWRYCAVGRTNATCDAKFGRWWYGATARPCSCRWHSDYK